MFKLLLSKFSHSLYIQLWENRIKVTNIKTGAVYDERPLVAISTKENGQKVISAIGNSAVFVESKQDTKIVNPFSHPRTLLSDFEIAEKLIRYVYLVLHRKSFFISAPKVVIQPMEKTEGGLTIIEKRAFQELAISAGAFDVVVYLGNEIFIKDFNYEAIKRSKNN
jgi:rod shape-determining protein MreB